MKNLLVIILMCATLPLLSQHKIGVRAGLNYSSLNGPLEQNESLGISNGFHFGINYTYLFPTDIGLRAELLYIQRGYKQFYTGDTYYIINPISPASFETFIEDGFLDYNIDISTSYVSIPLTFQYKFHKKFEVYAGASVDFLIGSAGRGKADFESASRPEDITFIESQDHRYGSDEAGEYNNFPRTNITIRVDGELVTIPKIVGGYYNYTIAERERGNKINGFNSYLIGGLNYFINSSFYIGARYEVGLMDVTNDAVDASLGELDEDDNLIFRSDSDKPYTFSVSFGFRF